MSERQTEFMRRNALLQYLPKMSRLIGRQVSEGDLMQVEETNALSCRLRAIPREYTSISSFNFDDLEKQWNDTLASKLASSHPGPVVVYAADALACGAMMLDSLSAFRCRFSFDVIPEGVISIATADGKNCATLDLCVRPTGEKIVEVELRGEAWSKIDAGSTRPSEGELI
jgi:hypothetical protein